MIMDRTVTQQWSPEMGEVRVKLALSNYEDESLAARGALPQEKIRRAEVDALVDTGATRLVLPKAVVDQLGLRTLGRLPVKYADERPAIRDRVGIVVIDLMGRQAEVDAVSEPARTSALLGQIPLEALDLWVDPKKQRLVPNPESPDAPLSLME